jgi:hypothetical protein
VIERSFGVLKMKWRVLLHMPSSPIEKQKNIIIVCMALHNFIRDSALSDNLFQRCDDDEDYIPEVDDDEEQIPPIDSSSESDVDMCAFRDFLANSLMADRE